MQVLHCEAEEKVTVFHGKAEEKVFYKEARMQILHKEAETKWMMYRQQATNINRNPEPRPASEESVEISLFGYMAKVREREQYLLGKSKTHPHEITLKTMEPIFVKQFKTKDDTIEEDEKQAVEWPKLGVIESARTKYSPIFEVMKKNEGVCLLQDFRALNAQTHVNKYCMRDCQ